jgi:MFS family permease
MMNVSTFRRYRTLIVLWFAQCFGQTASPVVVLLGGIVGTAIAPSQSLATLPVAMMIVGTATATIPAALFMSLAGRKAGFLLGTSIAFVAALTAAWSAGKGIFWLFCLATFLFGANGAFIQQFRFAVAESVDTRAVPRSLSILMLAGIVAGLLGPEMASRLSHIAGFPPFSAAFLGVAGLLCCSFIIQLFYRNQVFTASVASEDTRPLSEIFRQPVLVTAVIAAIVGWTVMTLVMTATPVSMHEMDHHSLADTTWVVQSHILAMYAPSLFSGYLVSRFGALRIIQAGIVLMVACVLAGYGRPQLAHYWLSMVLLGIGWNFLYLGGTTLLTMSYRLSERFKVQGLNDFLVFAMQAMASLGSGVLLATVGWNGVIFASLPWLVAMIVTLLLLRGKISGLNAASAG